MNPRYPVYIPSKGRADSRLTIKALEKMNVPYIVVIEEQEYDEYASVIESSKILILDKKYQDEYNTYDDLGDARSKGPGPARNFIWEHAIDLGAKRHWVMDDNISNFFRLNRNQFALAGSGTIFKCMEDFVDRYENVAMAGPNYFMFVKKTDGVPAYVLNTRIYSCNLIQNDVPFRWRGRYNEDTDLSLRMLKAKYCTVQFNAFLQYKSPTQTIKGGNTAEFYGGEGTLPKSQMIVDMHSDVATVVWKFSRAHHHVDYGPFKCNMLERTEGIVIKKGVNNYGMKIVTI